MIFTLLQTRGSKRMTELLFFTSFFSDVSVFVIGILQHPDGTVLKQLQPPPRGPREMQFYSKVTKLHSQHLLSRINLYNVLPIVFLY